MDSEGDATAAPVRLREGSRALQATRPFRERGGRGEAGAQEPWQVQKQISATAPALGAEGNQICLGDGNFPSTAPALPLARGWECRLFRFIQATRLTLPPPPHFVTSGNDILMCR